MTAGSDRIQPFRRPEAESCDYLGPEGVFWSRGRAILRSETPDGPLTRVATIPRPAPRRLMGLSRAGRRLGRETLYNLLPMPGGALFFSFARSAGIIRDGRVRFLDGLVRDCRILRGGAARLPDGSVVFGEYFDNAARAAVHLYRVRPGSTRAEIVHRFAPGQIRHVHSVSWDAHTGRAVAATGDVGDECRLVAFDPDFTGSEVLGMGTEDWRAISPQFTADAIWFGTDAQFRQNRLFRCDRATGALTPLADVNGPVFYSAPVGDGWVFATSAELCPSQTSPEAILYHVADAPVPAVTELARFAKDRWPRRLFQFGIVNFPAVAGALPGAIPISGTALAGLDARFRLIRTAPAGHGTQDTAQDAAQDAAQQPAREPETHG